MKLIIRTFIFIALFSNAIYSLGIEESDESTLDLSTHTSNSPAEERINAAFQLVEAFKEGSHQKIKAIIKNHGNLWHEANAIIQNGHVNLSSKSLELYKLCHDLVQEEIKHDKKQYWFTNKVVVIITGCTFVAGALCSKLVLR